jgi:hypothetical protein
MCTHTRTYIHTYIHTHTHTHTPTRGSLSFSTNPRCMHDHQHLTSLFRCLSFVQGCLSFVMQNSVLGAALSAATSANSGTDDLSQLSDALAFTIEKTEIQGTRLVFNANAQLSDATSLMFVLRARVSLQDRCVHTPR